MRKAASTAQVSPLATAKLVFYFFKSKSSCCFLYLKTMKFDNIFTMLRFV